MAIDRMSQPLVPGAFISIPPGKAFYLQNDSLEEGAYRLYIFEGSVERPIAPGATKEYTILVRRIENIGRAALEVGW
jgi:hypothetical protein